MKVQYLAAVAAASVLGLGTLTSCAPDTTVDTEEPAATEETSPDAMSEPASPDAMTDEADPCAAKPE
ncbi:MAG: hypothetical protein WA949_14685 [Phormidesmis sp.]